jgi:hypothetical protein
MNVALSLLTLVLLGADGPRSREAPEISFEVHIVQMDGLGWRGGFFSRLQPVATHAGASVWTTSRAAAEELAALDPDGIKAPRVTAASQAAAHVFHRVNRSIAAGVTRLADGPFEHATKVAYTPNYESIREGWALTLSGRAIDQGVLACVVLDDTRVTAVHHVSLTESLSAKECCAAKGKCAEAPDKIASRIDVPEIARVAVAGEWLIPCDGALVVSLGVQTTADTEGKARIIERLALIEAKPIPDEAVRQATLKSLSGEAFIAVPHLGAAGEDSLPPSVALPMPMPAMPSRSLPQALAADGSPLTLPPLPEEHSTPSSLPGSSEPCASPQVPNRKTPASSTVDTLSAKAGFTPEPRAETPALGRPFQLRFPFSAGNMNIEVEVRMTGPLSKTLPPRQSADAAP